MNWIDIFQLVMYPVTAWVWYKAGVAKGKLIALKEFDEWMGEIDE